MSELWTVERLIAWTQDFLAGKGIDSARLDAELLLAKALSCDRVALYLNWHKPIIGPELAVFRELVQRRAKREPAALLLGEREFWSRRFRVQAGVLIPRPETETVVEAALEWLDKHELRQQPITLLDLCTGSGNIAISLAAELPLSRVIATDVSPLAVATARQNAQELQVSDRVEVVAGSLFQALATIGCHDKFTIVTANPPYIPSAQIGTLMPEVRYYEPRSALDGGPTGIELARTIIAQAPAWLLPCSLLLLECGEDQPPRLQELLRQQHFDPVTVRLDYARRPRVVAAEWNHAD